MAIIYETTMTPTKLELLAAWLPVQPWYAGAGREPELSRAGGFRLDDPRGEVGIEFMVVTDASGEPPAAYLIPLTYRGGPLTSADEWLIGTAEHGVLGRRWVYDGTGDPVLVALLAALVTGQAEPQAQSVSDTPDPTVIVTPAPGPALAAAAGVVAGSAVVASGPSGTDLLIEPSWAAGRAVAAGPAVAVRRPMAAAQAAGLPSGSTGCCGPGSLRGPRGPIWAPRARGRPAVPGRRAPPDRPACPRPGDGATAPASAEPSSPRGRCQVWAATSAKRARLQPEPTASRMASYFAD